MNRSAQHAFEPEEVMAYLDGELPAQEAALLANHLEYCDECQAIGRELRQVSERMLELQVEPCPAKVDDTVLKAADEKGSELTTKPVVVWKPRRRRTLRWLAWAGGCAAALLIGARFLVPRIYESRSPLVVPATAVDKVSSFKARTNLHAQAKEALRRSNSSLAPAYESRLRNSTPSRPLEGPEAELRQLQSNGGATPVVQGPMIVQTASVTILASNFDHASGAIQRVTTQSGGYVEDLNANAQTGAARSLSATLRVPEKQLEAFLANLRKLGHVEQESRNNEEITDQYIDLTARLRNARAEEQRIIQLLQTRTGKLSDVLQAERELARVRGEIESMDGQRAYMEHQVSYATVSVEVDEEYRAQLNSDATSTGTQMKNSLIEGMRNLGNGVLAVAVFLFAYGPSILFWLGVIGIPAWFGWRQVRNRRLGAS